MIYNASLKIDFWVSYRTSQEKFKKVNPDIESTMKSHLINNLELFGIWNDNYDAFFEKRAKLLSAEIEKRIIKQEIDKKSQPDIQDDLEENV